MERTLENALERDTAKLDVYFMAGLSGQSSQSVLDSVEYSRRLYRKMGNDNRIYTFIAPMAPFLDPGSVIFEDPRKYGFTQLYRTLREHKEALYQPSWKLYLSYYTDWMSRDEIAESTYEAMIRMNVLKVDVGLTDAKKGKQITFGLNLARDIMRKIDGIIASTASEAERAQEYRRLKGEIEEAMRNTDYAKRELRMPGTAGLRLKGALKYLLRMARGK